MLAARFSLHRAVALIKGRRGARLELQVSYSKHENTCRWSLSCRRDAAKPTLPPRQPCCFPLSRHHVFLCEIVK